MQAEIQNIKDDLDQLGQEGFQVVEHFVEPHECDALSCELTSLFAEQQKAAKNKIGGVRNLLRNPHVSQFAKRAKLVSLLEEIVGACVPVRTIFFDKTTSSNWRVPWHQDLTIAVAERIEAEGFGPWSIKDQIQHVQPPQHILEKMITVRLHLDDCTIDNGPLKVIPGSHSRGKLNATEISNLTQTERVVTCAIQKGGVLIMRPLLLHSSSPAKSPMHRRILHIEYAGVELPGGLKWLSC